VSVAYGTSATGEAQQVTVSMPVGAGTFGHFFAAGVEVTGTTSGRQAYCALPKSFWENNQQPLTSISIRLPKQVGWRRGLWGRPGLRCK
jgi:hypothetical protein